MRQILLRFRACKLVAWQAPGSFIVLQDLLVETGMAMQISLSQGSGSICTLDDMDVSLIGRDNHTH